MNVEHAALRGALAEAENRKKRLELRIQGLAGSLRLGLNTALTPVAELEVPQLAEQMDQLVTAWADLQGAISEISRLQRELR